MADISFALNDPELGYTAFQVLRDTCTLSRGTASRSRETLSAGGCIHPGTPDMAQLLRAAGARGGGKPDMAQGSASDGTALTAARDILTERREKE